MPDSVRNQLGDAAQRLAQNSSSARLDAEILLAHVLDWPRSRLYARPDERLSHDAQQRYLSMLSARASGQPVAYLLGTQEFWSLEFSVSPDCLVPRPETEILVEWALSLDPQPTDVLDLGTGSGAIAIALATERPNWRISAVEQSLSALALARENALRHKAQIAFHQGSWLAPVAGQKFSLILSNPPYVAENDPHLSALQHEPLVALVAGQDGLADLRSIIADAPAHLQAQGWLGLEHGSTQGPDVRELLSAQGFVDVATLPDLAGLERISVGRWPGDA